MELKRIAATLVPAMLALALTGCAQAAASNAPDDEEVFASVSDAPSDEGRVWVRVERNKGELPKMDVEINLEPRETAEQPEETVDYYEPDYYEPETYNGPAAIQGNPDGLNSFVGVVEYGDHVETYYATSAVYDDQLSVDEQGFYRDSEGRYVVASSDHEIGEIIETSQGEAIVMDDGTAPGVVDMHVNWR